MTAKLFPHILSLVMAVERGSGPAVLSFILLKLWSGGSQRRQAIPPNRGSAAVLAQRVVVDAGTFHGEKSLQLKKNRTTLCLFTPNEYLCRNFLRYLWQRMPNLLTVHTGVLCWGHMAFLNHYYYYITSESYDSSYVIRVSCIDETKENNHKHFAYSAGSTLLNCLSSFLWYFCCNFCVLVHFQRPHSTVSHHQQGTVFSKRTQKSTTCPAPSIRHEVGD